ncbi:MAG TPA: tripartite tricarboxylate transporter substrate binding protein [Burkholderiales bacterium]|jgi:tripartite-type tricarboxylate transporter receptor subunit TctC|nr:tripartite tricarboxylate transporter substrate binding protein [Burkholderiales bacterium]
MSRPLHSIFIVAAGALLALCGLAVQAQQWPTKPVTMVNPFAPGGGVDAFGRPLSVVLSKNLGQQFIVENLAGAGGTIGAANAARRAGDGYNFFLGAVHHTIAESLYTKLPYSLERDFVPITVLAYVPNVVVVHPKHANTLKSLKDLIAYAKANPGKLNYGSAGNGTTHHLAGELFKTMTGVNLTHIPYKGAGPMMQDLLAGQVDMAFDGMSTSAPQIKAGKLKALAVTTAQRSFVDPNVPTMQEAGLPGYLVTTWYALWAPKGTPKEAMDRMYQETLKAMRSPELKGVWEAQGATAGGESPADFEKLVHSEIAKWAKVVKDAGAKIDN